MILLTLNLVPGKPGLCVWAHGILLIHGNLAFWVGTHHIFCEFSLRHFLIIRLKMCLLDKMTVHLTLCPSECHVGALDVLVCYWYWLGSLEQGNPLVPGCWLISRLASFKHFGPGSPLHSLKPFRALLSFLLFLLIQIWSVSDREIETSKNKAKQKPTHSELGRWLSW